MGHETQDSNPNAWVGVGIGHDEDTNKDITSILIQDKVSGDHYHFGYDVNTGEEIFGQIHTHGR